MKEFDLAKAKAGGAVCTRDGHSARIVCFDARNERFPIVALVECDGVELPFQYKHNGKYLDVHMDGHDLMMAGVKKEGWVNVSETLFIPGRNVRGVFNTKEDSDADFDEHCFATVKIEWEE